MPSRNHRHGFDRKFQQIVDRDAELEAAEREEIERARLAGRSLWEKILDLKIDDDLRDVLWALAEGRDD